MQNYRIYYVGTELEVAHHAEPLLAGLDIRIIDPSRVVEVAQTGDLAIFYSEHFNRFRDCWSQLNAKRCNTLYAIDGILEWRNAWENCEEEPACPWTMRPVLSDKVACIGASQARILDTWGNQGKTEIVGLPRLDRFKIVKRRETGNDQPFRLLVSTAKTPGFTTKQLQQITRSLQDLKAFELEHSSSPDRPIEICWRLTRDMHESIGVVNTLEDTSGTELGEVLKTVDAVITTPSTVILESMLAGLPTCVLDYTNSPRYVDAAWSITAADQIRATVLELFDPPQRRMFYQQTLLDDALYCHEPATERMQKLANEMIRYSHDCRAEGQDVVFPGQILPLPVPPAVFNPLNMFPQRSDELPDSGSLQRAHLDEMRRYVQVLEQRVRVVEQALEEADEVINGIHRHPILGSIVKIGDKAKSLGDLISGKTKKQQRSSKSAPAKTT